jgi:hypothetical protein
MVVKLQNVEVIAADGLCGLPRERDVAAPYGRNLIRQQPALNLFRLFDLPDVFARARVDFGLQAMLLAYLVAELDLLAQHVEQARVLPGL